MTTSRLYVGNLSYQTTEEGLKKTFSQYGNVLSINIIEGKGFGFIEMDSPESAEKAKDGLNNTELDGRNIRVDEARPRKEEGRGRPGGRKGRW